MKLFINTWNCFSSSLMTEAKCCLINWVYFIWQSVLFLHWVFWLFRSSFLYKIQIIWKEFHGTQKKIVYHIRKCIKMTSKSSIFIENIDINQPFPREFFHNLFPTNIKMKNSVWMFSSSHTHVNMGRLVDFRFRKTLLWFFCHALSVRNDLLKNTWQSLSG